MIGSIFFFVLIIKMRSCNELNSLNGTTIINNQFQSEILLDNYLLKKPPQSSITQPKLVLITKPSEHTVVDADGHEHGQEDGEVPQHEPPVVGHRVRGDDMGEALHLVRHA